MSNAHHTIIQPSQCPQSDQAPDSFQNRRDPEARADSQVCGRITSTRLLLLIVSTVFITLGMLASLLYLSWVGQMQEANPFEVLRTHLHVLSGLGAFFSTHLLLLGCLDIALLSLALYGIKGTAVRTFFTWSNATQVLTREHSKLHTMNADPASEQEWSFHDQSLAPGAQKTRQYLSSPPPTDLRLHRHNGYNTAPGNDQTSLQAFAEIALMQIYAQTLEVPIEQIKGTTHFFESGGDSETLQTFLKIVAHRLHITLNPDEVFDYPVVYHLATVITQKHFKQNKQSHELEPSLPYRQKVKTS